MRQRVMMMAVAGLVCSLGTVRAAQWTAIPTGRSDYQIWRGDEQLFSIETQVIGPGWARAEITKLAQAEGNRRVYAENVGFKTGRGGKGKAAGGRSRLISGTRRPSPSRTRWPSPRAPIRKPTRKRWASA